MSRKDIVDITKGHCLVGLLLLCLSCWSWYPVAAAPVDDESYVDYYKDYFENNGVHIYTSNYDWVPLAKKITTGCTTDYQRIKAIYYWVCDNIDYDTSFEIYRADSCIAYRKGVCQAYCEVFYQLAKVVGVRVELVNGYSKDEVGFVSGSGHTWLFAYTGEKRGIFLDPTWGAGIMRDHKFVRNTDYWKWFNVHPEWLILTHYPEKEAYQLIDNPITFKTFRSMPIAMPLWLEYGLKLHDIYMMVRNDSVSLPKFYNNGEGDFEIIDIPMCKSLKVGQFYTFRIRKKTDRELAIINGDEHCLEKDWTSEGNGVYSTTFMPRATGRLTFALKNNATNSNYSNLLEYSIDAPTSSDWQQVEKVYPLSVPDAKGVANLNIMYADAWEKAGVNGHKLLSIIRQQHITALPTIYNEKGQKLKILSVPMTNSLVLGQEYTFQFHPESGAEWAIVNNGKWYRDWKYTDGYYTMTIRPTRTGLLMLCVRMAEGGSFWSALSYEVQ